MKRVLFVILLCVYSVVNSRAQSFRIIPDHGSALSDINARIIGTGTHFLTDTIGTGIGVASQAFHDEWPTVLNDTEMLANFRVESVSPGAYDVAILSFANSFSPLYTLSQGFTVTDAGIGILSVSPDSGYRGANMGISVGTQGMDLTIVQPSMMLVLKGIDTIKVAWASLDWNVFHATFQIPYDAIPGVYDVQLVRDTATHAVIIGRDSSFTIVGDPGITFAGPQRGRCGEFISLDIVDHGRQTSTHDSVWLALNLDQSIRTNAFLVLRLDDSTLRAQFVLPPSLKTGIYDLIVQRRGRSFSQGELSSSVFRVFPWDGLALMSEIPFSNFALSSGLATQADGVPMLSFTTIRPGNVSVEMYDECGREILRHDPGYLTAGNHSILLHDIALRRGLIFYMLSVNEERCWGHFVIP